MKGLRVAIGVHKKYKSKMKSWEEVDDRIIRLELNKNG